MKPIELIAPQALQGLLSFGDRIGIRMRIPPRLAFGYAPVPVAYAGQLLEELATAAGAESFGLNAGAASRFEDSPLGADVRGSRTIGAALFAAAGASARYCGGQRLSVVQRGGDVWVQRRFPDSLRRGRRQANDWALRMLVDVVRRGAGPHWRPSELHLEGPAPGHADELAALSAGSTHFGAPADRMVFPAGVLAHRLPPAPGREAHASVPLPDVDFVASIRETIRWLLELGQLNLPSLAEAAGTSVRSLHRQLAELGLRFRRLVEDARCDAACRLLGDPAIRITDISAELGYSDAANFTRAFRRWTGVSPLSYRRSLVSRSVNSGGPDPQTARTTSTGLLGSRW